MYAYDVIPITKGILKEKLTYFSLKDIPLGSIVEVPIRKKIVKALVTGKNNVSEIKSQLRGADFSVRKIGAVKVKNLLSPQFISSAEELARFFVSSTGAVLNNLIPKSILEISEKLKNNSAPAKNYPKNSHEKLTIQADEDDRFTTYRNLIREEFAKNFSVLFIVPTLEDLNKAQKILEKGIGDFTFCFWSGMTKKELEKKWNKAVSLKHPVLIIATPQFMFLPRDDFNTIVVERENSSAYKQLVRPYLDIRIFAENLSKKMGIRLVFGDFLLRTEIVWRQKNLEFAELTPMKFRSVSSANQEIIFLNKPKSEEKSKEFSPLSPELIKLIESSQKNNEQIFIFGLRKGLSPLLSCSDCGKIVECPNCSTPIALHEENGTRKLICHKCGTKKEVVKKCANCQSWRLFGFGIGLGLLEKEIKNQFPKAKIFRLDKEKTKTPKQAGRVIEEFTNSTGAILIGSEMALFYLNEKVDNVVCATADALFSIPDFRINEKILSLMLRLRSLARKNFFIQTRLPDLPLWQKLISGSLLDFYREELEVRKSLSYPPFSLLIKIVIQSSQKTTAEKEAEKASEILKDYQSITYPSFISKIKGKFIMNVLLKIDPASWPNEELLNILNSLPPKLAIKVDPENIL